MTAENRASPLDLQRLEQDNPLLDSMLAELGGGLRQGAQHPHAFGATGGKAGDKIPNGYTGEHFGAVGGKEGDKNPAVYGCTHFGAVGEKFGGKNFDVTQSRHFPASVARTGIKPS